MIQMHKFELRSIYSISDLLKWLLHPICAVPKGKGWEGVFERVNCDKVYRNFSFERNGDVPMAVTQIQKSFPKIRCLPCTQVPIELGKGWSATGLCLWSLELGNDLHCTVYF